MSARRRGRALGAALGISAALMVSGRALADEGAAPASSPTVAAEEEAPASASAPTSAPARDAGGDGKVVVTGKRRRGPSKASAAAVELIDTTEARHESTDMGTLLDRTKGVNLRRSGGLGAPTRFSLQGFSSNRVRFFIDGAPASASGLGLRPSDLPVNLIERVEIYKGVVPIRFGADALGGAVNFVTREDEARTSMDTSLELGSFGTFRGSTIARVALAPDLGLFAGVNAFFDRADNDYEVEAETANLQGQTERVTARRFHDGYEAYGLDAHVGVLGRAWADRLTLGISHSRTEKELQNNSWMSVPYGDIELGGGSNGLRLHYLLRPRRRRPLGVELVADYAERDQWVDDVSYNIWSWSGEVTGTRAVPGERSRSGSKVRRDDRIASGRLTLTYKLDNAHQFELSASPLHVHRDARSTSTYGAAHTWTEEEYAHLKIVSGASWRARLLHGRLENELFGKHYYSDPDGPPTGGLISKPVPDPSHDFGGGDALRLSLWPWLYLKGSYEYATRLPDPREMFGDGALLVSNTALRPETSHNMNLGVTLDELETPAGRFDAEVTYFSRDTEDLIFLSPSLDTSQYQNISNVETKGFEGGLSWTGWGRLTLGANGTLLNSITTSTTGPFAALKGDRIPNLPFLYGNLNAALRLSLPQARLDRLRLYWYGHYVREYFLFWESQGDPDHKLKVPDQFTQRAGLSLTSGGGRITSALEVHNLTDEAVYDNVGVQLAGRAYHLKLVIGLD